MQEGAGGAGRCCQAAGRAVAEPGSPFLQQHLEVPLARGALGVRMESWIILPVGQSLLLPTAESDEEQGTAQGQRVMVVGDAAPKHRGGCCPPTPRAQAGSQLLRVTLQGQQDPLRNQTAVVDKARSTVTYYITSKSNLSAVVLYDSRNVSAGASLPPQLLFAAFLCTLSHRTQSRGKENVHFRGVLGQGWVFAAPRDTSVHRATCATSHWSSEPAT